MEITPEIYYLLLGGSVVISVIIILSVLSYLDKHKKNSKEA